MNVHLFMKRHGVEGMVLARFEIAGQQVMLGLQRSAREVHLIDHTNHDDPEDVRGLNLDNLAGLCSDWLKDLKVPDDKAAEVLASIKAKLQMPPDPKD